MKMVDVWELHIGFEIYLFASHADACGASAAMIRGAVMYSPSDPDHKGTRAGLSPIEARIQRRQIPVPMYRAVAALGAGVQASVVDATKKALPRLL
jgi:hypothetical protein